MALKILYLDDSEVLCEQLRSTLAAAGYDVVTACTIAAARDRLMGRDLIIIDWHMPEMNGAAALALLKAHRTATPDALYYLYTTDVAAATGFKVAGFDGALTMKGDAETLLSRVELAARVMRMRRFVSGKR
jgi:CheY-like chemotaxis protein